MRSIVLGFVNPEEENFLLVSKKKTVCSGIIFCSWFGIIGCSYDGPRISVEELRQRIKSNPKGVTLIDVRDSSEFKKGHVPGSKNVPLKYLGNEVDIFENIEGDLAVISTDSSHAESAAKLLMGIGLDIVLVEEGLDQWIAAGYPLEQGTSTKFKRAQDTSP